MLVRPDALWLGICYGTNPDYMNLFAAGAQWSDVQADLTTFCIDGQTVYQQTEAQLAQTMADVAKLENGNVTLQLGWGVLPIVGEVGYGCSGFCPAFPELFEQLLVAAAYAKTTLGVTVSTTIEVNMEEELYNGSLSTKIYYGSNGQEEGYAPQWSIAETASQVAAQVAGTKAYDPNVEFGDTEPFPQVSVADIETWIADYKADTGENLAFLQADTSWGRPGVLTELEQVSSICQADGIPFNIIIDGESSNPTSWTNQALANLISVYLDPNIVYNSLEIENWELDGATSVLNSNLSDTSSGVLTVAARYAAIIGSIAGDYETVYGRTPNGFELFLSTQQVGTDVITQAQLTSVLTTLAPLNATLEAYTAAGDALPDAADLTAGVAPGADPAGSPDANAASVAASLGDTLEPQLSLIVPDITSAVVNLTDSGIDDPYTYNMGNIYIYGAAAGSGTTRTLVLPVSASAIINVMAPAASETATLTVDGPTLLYSDFIYLASGDITYVLGNPYETIIDATGTGNSTVQGTPGNAGSMVQGSDGTIAILIVSGAGAVDLNAGDKNVTVELNAATTSVSTGVEAGETVVLASAATSVDNYYGVAITIDAAAAFAGALITGGGESINNLVLTSGGNATLNSGDSGLTVQLAAGSNLTLGTGADIAVIGSAGTDTVTVDALSQSVTAATGSDVVNATAALAGVTVTGNGNTVLNITAAGTETLSNSDSNLTVVLPAGSNALTLGYGADLAVNASQGSDTITTVASRAGASVTGNSQAATTLVITSDGDATLSDSDSNLTVELAAGTPLLTLGSATNIEVNDSGNSADDVILLGDTSQSVIAGSGTEVIEATAVLAGNSIKGNSESTTSLRLTASGTMALSNADSNLSVYLAPGTSSLDLGTGANIFAEGTAGAASVLSFTIGNASQTVDAYVGTDKIYAGAWLAGATVLGAGESATTFNITTPGFAALNNADSNLTVQLEAGTTINLGTGSNIAVIASARDNITVGAVSQSITGATASDVIAATAALAGVQITAASLFETHLRVTTSGVAELNNADSNVAVLLMAASNTLVLGNGSEIAVNATYGTDTIDATSSQAADAIIGAGELATQLVITSAGPAALNNADSNLTVKLTAGSGQLTLGSGSNLLVNDAGNSSYACIVLGSAKQSVVAGTGTTVVDSAAAFAGDAIVGNGTGTTHVHLSTAGTAALSDSDCDLTLYLATGTNDISLGSGSGITVVGTSASDTIVLGGTSQTVEAGSGTETVDASASDAAADEVTGFSQTTTTLLITGGGSTTLDVADDNLTVKLANSGDLVLNAMQFITADASIGNSDVTTQAAGQTVLAGTSDVITDANGSGFKLVGTASNLNLERLENYGAKDVIDITNFTASGASVVASATGSGTELTIACGGQSAVITLAGFYGQGTFQLSSDGSGGTLLHYVA